MDDLKFSSEQVRLIKNEDGELVPTGSLDPRNDDHTDMIFQIKMQKYAKDQSIAAEIQEDQQD